MKKRSVVRSEDAEVSENGCWHEYQSTSTSTSTNTKTGEEKRREERRGEERREEKEKKEEEKRERESKSTRGHELTRVFQGPINEWPPAAGATGPINPTPILGPRFDLFYVMPATPESISRGTLLFCVCMHAYMHSGQSRPKRFRTYLQLSAVGPGDVGRREKPVRLELDGN